MATKLLDVSFWQDTLDFSKIKKAGYDNIILRAGYRTTIDSKFNEYATACKKNNINIVAVYWFIYATNLAEVKANANKCLEVIKPYKPKIVFVDFEYDTIDKAAKKGVKLGAKECDSFTIEFCEIVKKAGYIPGYYANMEYYNKMYSSKVKNKATSTTALATYPQLNRGNLVDVIGVSGSRYKIKIANAYIGYIDKAKITTPDKLTKSEYPYVGKCTGNDVAVRKDAGTSYAKISGYPTLNKDNKVDVLGVKKDSFGNKWKQVKIANKYIGYVFGKGKCCPDAIANALIDMYKEMKNSIFSDDIETSNVKSKVIKKNTEDKEQSVNVKNPCPVCGEELTFEGGCNVCKACGWSKCD